MEKIRIFTPQMHQLLHMLKREPQRGDSDSNSGCSAGDGSNADSGRGGSEDGDQQHNQGSNTTKHLDDHNSPPPPYGTIYFTHSLTFNSFSIFLLFHKFSWNSNEVCSS